MSKRKAFAACAIGAALVAVALLVHADGFPDRPNVPDPPQWMSDASSAFLKHAATPLYALLTLVSFAVWGVLRWQRRPDETWAARSFRVFLFAKAWLWLILSVTRWIAPAWRLPLYVIVVVYIFATTVYVLAALFWTYVRPSLRHEPAPPLEGTVIPEPKHDEWDGEERRIGPPDRRRRKIGA